VTLDGDQDSPQVAKYPSFGHTGVYWKSYYVNQKRQKRANNEAFCAGKGSEMVTKSGLFSSMFRQMAGTSLFGFFTVAFRICQVVEA
jgi:hypothetical protein